MYPLKFRIENRKEIPFKVPGTAFIGGRLQFDQIFNFIVIKIMSSPLRDGATGEGCSEFHVVNCRTRLQEHQQSDNNQRQEVSGDVECHHDQL
jgi:hypothetical protein